MRILTAFLAASLLITSQTGYATPFFDEPGPDPQSFGMERHNQLKALIESYEKDFEKSCVTGNQAAGVRLRKHMQELRQMAQDIRVEISLILAQSNNPDGQPLEAAEDESISFGFSDCPACIEGFNQLKTLVDSFEKDFEKFYVKGNLAAGVRLRRHMQELRQMAMCIMQTVQQGLHDEPLEGLD